MVGNIYQAAVQCMKLAKTKIGIWFHQKPSCGFLLFVENMEIQKYGSTERNIKF